jgi:hypothetical protein
MTLSMFPQGDDNIYMISLDHTPRTTLSDRDHLSADELSTRIPDAPVTRVPQGPTGLWDALAAAATRRRRAETQAVAGAPVVDVTVRLQPHGTAVDILDMLGVDVVPLPG